MQKLCAMIGKDVLSQGKSFLHLFCHKRHYRPAKEAKAIELNFGGGKFPKGLSRNLYQRLT